MPPALQSVANVVCESERASDRRKEDEGEGGYGHADVQDVSSCLVEEMYQKYAGSFESG